MVGKSAKARSSGRTRGSARRGAGPALLKQELQALAARLEQLEATQAAKATLAEGDADKYWAIHRLLQGGAGGGIVYAGAVTLPTGGHFRWQRLAGTRDILKSDWSALDRVLAGLAHPVRLQLLKAVMEGKTSKAKLEGLAGMGTTGQLYHHLKMLERAGWLRSLARGVYEVPGERVVSLLAILTAASS